MTFSRRIVVLFISVLLCSCTSYQKTDKVIQKNPFEDIMNTQILVMNSLVWQSIENEQRYKEYLRVEEEKRLAEEKRKEEERIKLEEEKRIELEKQKAEELKSKTRQQTTEKKTTQSVNNTNQSSPPSTPTPQPVIGNAFQREFLNLINQERARKGLSILKLDVELNNGAQVRANELATINDIRVNGVAHVRPDGRSFRTVLPHRNIGENVGGSWDVLVEREKHTYAYHAFDMWKASAGHYEVMVFPNLTSIGVAYQVSERMKADGEVQVDWSGLVFVLFVE